MQLYCSTGAFVGKVNNRNYKLIEEVNRAIVCDGFEFMIYESWTDKLLDIARYIRNQCINIPVVHSDKKMGIAISACTHKSHNEAVEKLILNCKAASILGAKYVLIHPWGYPGSDAKIDEIVMFLPELSSICEDSGLELLIEMVVGNLNDPIYNIKKVLGKLPKAKLAVDTRHLAFHGKLESLYRESDLVNNIEHVHISDYVGGTMDWSKMRHVLHPGTGNINFKEFIGFLKSIEYSYGITLESWSADSMKVDTDRINESLEFIRQLA